MRLRLARLLQVATVAAVLAVFLLAWLDLRREEQRALDDFAAAQASVASGLAATLQARVDGVFRDLQDAGDAGPGQEAWLRRLLTRGGLYREVDLLDATGRPLLELPAAARIADSPTLRAARDAQVEAARNGARVSPPLRRGTGAADREHLRLFVEPAGPGFVVLLVDCDRLLDGLAGENEAGAPARWLILDDTQHWIDWAAGDLPGATERQRRADDRTWPRDVTGLLETMGQGGAGAVELDREAALSLGLERRRAVAGFAPVHLAGSPWSVAVVSSGSRVRDRARVGLWRLATATGLAALLAGAFGLIVAWQQRRTLALAEALRISEATAALRERAEKIVDTIPIGVLALDRSLRVSAANRFLTDRQVTAGTSLGNSLSRARPPELEALEALVGEARGSDRVIERAGLRMRLATDETRDIDAYAIPLARPLPDTDCFLVLHDRTETRALERNLARADKLATIGTLAAGVAHEVGTPLGIISGRAEQLLSRVPAGDGAEATRRAITSILAQVDKVSTTIRQLLDFARVRPIEATAIAPAHMLETARALLEHRFRQAKVSLSVAAEGAPPIAGDPGQLEQVFVNLLMNAVDACTPGGAVRVAATQRGTSVVFEIADDGCGISPEHLRSVFDPFFTTKKRGQGTGLGLTIASDIVKNHGGTLEIDSVAGAGATARVTLPLAKETA